MTSALKSVILLRIQPSNADSFTVKSLCGLCENDLKDKSGHSGGSRCVCTRDDLFRR